MTNLISKKINICSLCGREFFGNLTDGAAITCWLCVHNLFTATEEKKKELHKLLMDRGRTDKAEMVESFITEEMESNVEAGKFVEREGFSSPLKLKSNG